MKRPRKSTPVNKRLLSTYLPPEGVPLRFEVGTIGSRFAAQIADILLTMAFILAMILLFLLLGLGNGNFIFAFAVLMFFMIRVPYYVLTELFWNGQTLGKKMMGLRVISTDGRRLSPYAVTVRNMMKEAEVFGPGTALFALEGLAGHWQILILIWVGIVLAVPLFSRRKQRLGDMVAGTYVVYAPKAILLPELTERAPMTQFVFTPDQLNAYGRYELQTLEKLLRVQPASGNAQARDRRKFVAMKVCNAICRKIEYPDQIRSEEAETFLTAFYNAQRAFLENRQLFGDKRDDKFHANQSTETKDRNGQKRGQQ